jgi:hypothetical protein
MQIPISYKYSLRGPGRATFFTPGISCQQPYWDHFRAFADCEARLCALAAGGGHVAQVALFYPAADMQAHFREHELLAQRSRDYGALGDRMRYAGYDFDILDDQSLLDEARLADGRLETATERFDVLVVPQVDVFRRAALGRVVELVRAGGTAVFAGGLPRHSVEGGADDPELRRMLFELLGEGCHQAIAPGGARWQACGRGRAGVASDLDGAVGLLRTFAVPDVQANPPSQTVVAYHRRLDDGELYLLFHHGNEPLTAVLTLSAKGVPERWDPMTGAAEGVADYSVSHGGTAFTLRFEPQELIPVFLHRNASRAAPVRRRTLLREIPIRGPFRFRIEETLKRPEIAWNLAETERKWTSKAGAWQAPDILSAGDWCGLGLAYFSGIGHYETSVDLETLPAGTRVVLSLGRVGVSAAVSVNGHRAGIVIFEPYELDITDAVAPGRNRLVISVANTLANYYSQFEELANGKPFEGGVVPEHLASGLMGPVSLRLIRCD